MTSVTTNQKPHNARNAADPGPARAEPEALQHVRVVLVETQQPRNIGSIARAMKTMGLNDLALVRPLRFPHKDALDLASGADDLLGAARVFDTLFEAVADCVVVYGASARRRHNPMPELTPRACAKHAAETIGQVDFAQRKIALVFGSEPAGLDNESLLLCQYLLQIPANPSFASLNLAAAVQIVCYEMRLAMLEASATPLYQPTHVAASVREFDGFFEHFVALSDATQYFGNKSKSQTTAQLKRIFQRAQLGPQETKMLRGWLSQIQHTLKLRQ